jgi:lysozyme
LVPRESVGAGTPRDFGITPELVEFIKKQEGWVPHPYICPAGYPTIGWGHRIPSMDTPSITKERGEEILKSDLRSARDAVVLLSPEILGESDRRCAALIDFIFNLGAGRYRASTLRKRVAEKNWPEAAKEMRRWVYAAGRIFKPLVKRRAVAASWLEEG